ncbi:hypothetical protein EKO27_g2265 [Xylaria grammica]|uniref:Uncharacterized protein n=1 Tax=Xylaria grammica TaxID=363999 RepID=A0A439DEP0_9PEZI|nr:hypothetical protein EKO27_g2265 [Xylaria grammica]
MARSIYHHYSPTPSLVSNNEYLFPPACDGLLYPSTPSSPELASDASPQDEDAMSEVDDNVLSTGTTPPSSNATTGEAIASMNSANSSDSQNTQVYSMGSHSDNFMGSHNSSPSHGVVHPQLQPRAPEPHVSSRSSGSPGSRQSPWLELVLNPEPPAYEPGNPQRPQLTRREIGSPESHFQIVGIQLPLPNPWAHRHGAMYNEESEWRAPVLSPRWPEANRTNTNGLCLPPILSDEDVPRVLEPPVHSPSCLAEHSRTLDHMSLDYLLG